MATRVVTHVVAVAAGEEQEGTLWRRSRSKIDVLSHNNRRITPVVICSGYQDFSSSGKGTGGGSNTSQSSALEEKV